MIAGLLREINMNTCKSMMHAIFFSLIFSTIVAFSLNEYFKGCVYMYTQQQTHAKYIHARTYTYICVRVFLCGYVCVKMFLFTKRFFFNILYFLLLNIKHIKERNRFRDIFLQPHRKNTPRI